MVHPAGGSGQLGCIWLGCANGVCMVCRFVAQKIGQVLEHMMRNFFGLVLLMAVCVSVSAETRVLNKPVTCDNTATVLNTLVTEFEETPQWQGTNTQQGTRFLLTVNLTTGAWTLVELNSTTACVIGVGENALSRWGTPVRHTQ